MVVKPNVLDAHEGVAVDSRHVAVESDGLGGGEERRSLVVDRPTLLALYRRTARNKSNRSFQVKALVSSQSARFKSKRSFRLISNLIFHVCEGISD